MTFKKSTFCNGNGCVEVRLADGEPVVADPRKNSPVDGACDPGAPTYAEVRHTDHPDLVLRFDRDEWAAFVAGVQAGEFDVV